MPNHYVGDLLLTIEISGLSRVRTELMQLAGTLWMGRRSSLSSKRTV